VEGWHENVFKQINAGLIVQRWRPSGTGCPLAPGDKGSSGPKRPTDGPAKVIASRRSKLFSGTTAAIFILHRGTLHRTVGTKDAAVACLWTQHSLAVRAFVEKLAGVGRHHFSFSEAAKGAHQHGFKKNFAHTRFTGGPRKDNPRPQSLWLAYRDSLYQDQMKCWRFSCRNPL